MQRKEGQSDVESKIKVMLERNGLPVVWLINQLHERGIDTNSDEMSKIFRGKRTGAKVSRIITESLLVIAKYEKCFMGENAKKEG